LCTLRANKNQQKYKSEGNSFHVLKCNQRYSGLRGERWALDSLMKFYVVNNCAENEAGKKSKRSRDRSPGAKLETFVRLGY
jgi:hypothetical protein